MCTINSWHRLYLYFSKIALASLFIFILVFSSTPEAQAQLLIRKKNPNKTKQKNKTTSSFRKGDSRNTNAFNNLSYGFFIGVHSARVMAVPEVLSRDTANVNINPQFTFGFSLGFLANYSFSNRWEIRFQPGAGFYEYNIDYLYRNNATGLDSSITQTVEATMLELPLLLKYRSKMRNGKGMFMTVGVKPAFAISSQQAENEDNIRMGTMDLSIEYGFGFDMNFQYFKFSPEIRFSHGLINRAIKDDNFFANSTSTLNTHTISLILNFGGKDPY